MAKRLNKKIVFIGSGLLLVCAVAAVFVVLNLSKDPQQYIKDAQAARAAKDYKNAEQKYAKAIEYTKNDSGKLDLLYEMVGMFYEDQNWAKIRGCWDRIVKIDPDNIQARLGLISYLYVVAGTGDFQMAWQEILNQSKDMLAALDRTKQTNENIDKWPSYDILKQDFTKKINSYIYLVKGRAQLELVKLGAVTDPQKSLEEAESDLKKFQELEPANINSFWYLSQVAIEKGNLNAASTGTEAEKTKALQLAIQELKKGVEGSGGDPKAQINLLRVKLNSATSEDVKALEPEFMTFGQKFSTNAEAQALISEYYLRSGFDTIDKAMASLEKSCQLDKNNIDYALRLAVLRYRKFSVNPSEKSNPADIYAAIKIANDALTMMGPEGNPGPKYYEERKNRISLYMFLAKCYIEQILEPCEQRNEQQKREWMKNAEQMVSNITQFYDSAEQTDVIKWKGMLDLAKGNVNEAARKLYLVQERLKAAGRKDVDVCYALANIYKNGSEIGAVREFLETALDAKKLKPEVSIASSKPFAILDYAEILLKLRAPTYAIPNIQMYESRFGANARSNALAVKAYIGAKQFDEAEKVLASLNQDDPATMRLYIELLQSKIEKHTIDIAQQQNSQQQNSQSANAQQDSQNAIRAGELKNYKDALAAMVGKLLTKEPKEEDLQVVVTVCNNYIDEKQLASAKDIIDKYLSSYPTNTTMLFYKQMLLEPGADPKNITQQRRDEIEKSILVNIADPKLQAVNLGSFYGRTGDPNKAMAELNKVFNVDELSAQVKDKPLPEVASEISESEKVAARSIFDLAIQAEKYELAEQVTNIAEYKNIDDCKGKFLKARLNVANKEYTNALANLDICIEEKPVFSYAYMLRSNVNSLLDKQAEAIKDAEMASTLNPMDGKVAKVLVDVLYQRNQKLGQTVSPEQVVEFRTVLDRAMALNPSDLQLMSFYAEFIFGEDKQKALAIRQSLQAKFPNFNNALLLGKMAMKIAKEEPAADKKKAYLEMSISALDQAKAIEPQNANLLQSYVDYYQLSGKGDMAEQMIQKSEDKTMLYSYYMQQGKFQEANEIMLQLYKKNSKDVSAIKGLLMVAEKVSDKQAVMKYSEELLAVEDTAENQLFQIQTYLKLGLIQESSGKIQSFKQKYPNDNRASLLEAWLSMKQGGLETALDLTNKILEKDQENVMAWRLRGEINYLTANYDQAINDLTKSNTISDSAATRIMLARVYMQVNKNDDAIRELEAAIKLPEDSTDARLMLEQTYLKFGKSEALKTFYKDTLEKFKDSMLWYNQAGTFYTLIKDYATAEKIFDQAWHGGKKGTKQDIENAFNGYLQSLLLAGKTNEAFAEAQKYIDSEYASIALITIAEIKSKTSDKQGVMEYCQKAINKTDQSDAVKSWILKKMYLLVGADETLKYCQESLKSNPNSLMLNYIMFDLMNAGGQYNNALPYVDKCVELAGQDSEQATKYTISKVMVLQSAYSKTQDKNYLRQAISEYESLLKKMPNNYNVLNNLAYMLAENDERLEDALKYAKKAYESMPNNSNFLDTYSYVLYKNGKLDDAEKYLRAAQQQYAVEKATIPYDVYEHLGMIKEKLGKISEAINAYKQASEAGKGTMPKYIEDRINTAINRLESK